MKRIILMAALLTAPIIMIGCGGGENKDAAALEEVPADYAKLEKPEFTDALVKKGEAAYTTNCTSCHGPKADGDSPAGKSFKPPAANLVDKDFQEKASDNYLFWRISEGKGKGMTAYKSLSEENRWALVAYLRSLKQ